jgi:hypothetical protein
MFSAVNMRAKPPISRVRFAAIPLRAQRTAKAGIGVPILFAPTYSAAMAESLFTIVRAG